MIIGGVFAVLLFSGITDALAVHIASAIAVLIALGMIVALVREIRAVLASGQDWVVKITENALIWDSPVPEQMQPFTLALTEIAKTRRTMTHYRNSDKSADNIWEILLHDGPPLKIDEQLSGINPEKVFNALAQRGITFEKRSVTVDARLATNRTTGQ
ncbi:hypothetical protein ACJ5NV_12005 [Loktanella agnita]|uniref:hypothetical protein n=1 Tax=Loktanella agnita TaxID=287097 RepID=UPI003986AF90